MSELCVLAEKPVARVNAIGATFVDGVKNCLGIEVTLGCGLATEGICLVSEANVKGVSIEFGIDRNGLNSEFSGRTNYSDGDFSTVGDEDFLEHE